MEKLLQLVIAEDLKLIYMPLRIHKEGLHGMYLPARKLICLDAGLKKLPKLHRCVLAEELGHHFTGSRTAFAFYPSYSVKRKMTTEDEKALRWATDRLIPTNELLRLFDEGFHKCKVLADYFGVTAWLLFRKMEFLQCAGKYKIDRQIISTVKLSCL